MPSKTEKPEDWLDDYGDMLYCYALLRVRSEATAEDLVQETLLAGFQGFEKFSGKSSVRTWLMGILKHKIIDFFRKNRHEQTLLKESDLGEDLLAHQFDQRGHWSIELLEWKTPDQHLSNKQFQQIFQQCLSRLPQRMLDLFMLRTIDGVSSEDCCDILGFDSNNQLWVTLSRTRMRLRQCLEIKWFSNS